MMGVDAPIEISEFEAAEIDHVLLGEDAAALEAGPLEPPISATSVSRLGDTFQLGRHRLIRGDARDPEIVRRPICDDPPAQLPLTDEPYNVSMMGTLSRGAHREISEAERLAFNLVWSNALNPFLSDGAVMGTFIDWRGYPTVHAAAVKAGLTPLDLVAWGKSKAGMGSL